MGTLGLSPDRQEEGSWRESALCSGRMATYLDTGSKVRLERPQCRGCALVEQEQGLDSVTKCHAVLAHPRQLGGHPPWTAL